MNLKDEDLLNAIESYKNRHGLKDVKMAEICGMSSPSVYNNWKKRKTKTLKFKYLLSFLINTKIDAAEFLEKLTKQNYFEKKELDTVNEVFQDYRNLPTSPGNDICTNPVCLAEKVALHKKIEDLQTEKIKWLEGQEGGSHSGKKSKGGVEESLTGT